MSLPRMSLVLTVAVALAAASACSAAKLEVGAPAPEFKGIGTDDKEHKLSDYKDAKAVVVVFTCNHCPVAVAYEDRLIQLQKDYADKGVQVLAVCVNDVDADRLPAMKKRAEEKGFNFPYIRDDSQASARAYGATVTPHIFLLDGKRNVAYIGSVDDSQNPANVKQNYLRDAIDAVLAGETPDPASTRAFGCTIKWAK